MSAQLSSDSVMRSLCFALTDCAEDSLVRYHRVLSQPLVSAVLSFDLPIPAASCAAVLRHSQTRWKRRLSGFSISLKIRKEN